MSYCIHCDGLRRIPEGYFCYYSGITTVLKTEHKVAIEYEFVPDNILNSDASTPSRYPLPDRDGCEMGWNTRQEPDGLPEWLRNALIDAVVCAKDDGTKGWNDALSYILSLKKPEDTNE